ncbi:MAG: heparan-alpha-glucosaminide N-acetyltransferase domain-containing protein [Acidobacteriota bacterium]
MTAEKVRERIYSIDFLRGVVMMIMLLDHTRDFVHHGALTADPTDLSTTTVPLFFTRWITHYCAPTFVFLSGISIYLQRLSGKSNTELSRFLFTRGLWLIFLEFTLVRLAEAFNFHYGTFFGMAQVIWVIGVSMILMAALIWLPVRVTGLLGLLMIVFHNLLDRYAVDPGVSFSGTANLGQSIWMVFHQMGVVPLGSTGSVVFLAYPLIPWIGVMAAGWAFGTIYGWEAERRRKVLSTVGVAATVLFIAIRFVNIYGDPSPRVTQSELAERSTAQQILAEGAAPAEVSPQVSEPAFSVLSFLNTTKYPPSLLYLLMTLGPALIVLRLTDGIDGEAIWQRIPIVYGRVPMFYYLLQWFTAHGLAVLLTLFAGKNAGYLFINFGQNIQSAPADYGFSLSVTYAVWIAGLIILYPLCYWYGEYKRANKSWLLSYL